MVHSTIRKALSSLNLLMKRSEYLSLFTKYLHNNFFGKVRNVHVFMIKGLVRNTDYSITALFVGSEESAYQFAHLIYSEIERSLSLGKFMVCQINPFHWILEQFCQCKNWLGRNCWFFAPKKVSCLGAFPGSNYLRYKLYWIFNSLSYVLLSYQSCKKKVGA